jgi:hypothetical protein
MVMSCRELHFIRAALGWMSLWCRLIFYQLEMIENTAGLNGPGSKGA